jgi:hypothetical protein
MRGLKFQIDSKKHIWKQNRTKMKVQIVANVVHVFVAIIPSLL